MLGENLALSFIVCFGNDVISAILFDPVKDHVGVPVFNDADVWIIIPLSGSGSRASKNNLIAVICNIGSVMVKNLLMYSV